MVPFGSLMNRITSHITSPNAITNNPIYVSLIKSEGAGLKHLIPSSRYSLTASQSHINEAPQYIYISGGRFIVSSFLMYQRTDTITAANKVINNVILASGYAVISSLDFSFAFFAIWSATPQIPAHATVTTPDIATPTVDISDIISAVESGLCNAVKNGA